MSDKTVALPEARKHAGFLKANLREYGMLLSLFAIMLFFEFVTDGTLLRPLNLTNLVLQNSYIVIMALGMLLVIVTGHIDLSVGSVAGFIGAIAAVLMVRYGMLVFKGLALAVLQGQSVGPFSPTFQKLSSGFIPEMFPSAGALYPTSILIGAVLALGLVYVSVKTRARRASHGVEVEPTGFFAFKNAVLFGVIIYFTYLIASHRGLPNVLVIMIALIALYGFVTARTTMC